MSSSSCPFAQGIKEVSESAPPVDQLMEEKEKEVEKFSKISNDSGVTAINVTTTDTSKVGQKLPPPPPPHPLPTHQQQLPSSVSPAAQDGEQVGNKKDSPSGSLPVEQNSDAKGTISTADLITTPDEQPVQEQKESSAEPNDQLMDDGEEEEEEEGEDEKIVNTYYLDDDDSDDDYDYVDSLLENTLKEGGLTSAGSTNGSSSSGKKDSGKPPRGKKRKRGGPSPSGGDEDEEEEEEEENEGEEGSSGPGVSLERKRMVLIKREQDHFEILPEGWVEITHFSGMPVYLHKASRVCTLSKPYLLGAGSARKHDVPISAIPCLHYRKGQEKEKLKQQKTAEEVLNVSEGNAAAAETSAASTSVNLAASAVTPTAITTTDSIAGLAKVETLAANKREKSVDFSQLREYCLNLFQFRQVTIHKFRTWADRRKHAQTKKLSQRPSLPESTKLITCSVPKGVAGGSPGKAGKKEFIMNPAGKSVVCILHEFVQHTGRTQPKYKFQELENVAKPYSATVVINDMQYGIGYGSSKKEAKTEAARASLEILIPDLNVPTEGDGSGGGSGGALSNGGDGTSGGQSTSDSNDLSFFDNIRIEDSRVSELCQKAGQYSPYQILVECLRRHYGVNDDQKIETEVRLLKHQRNEYKMKVGEHEASVICKNKREGKQRAAQSILQKLHPNLNSWGALLKLYGRGSCKTPKEKREEAQQITELQSMACSNQPNYKILAKLREEMLKLRQRPPPSLPPTPINSIQLPSIATATAANISNGGAAESAAAEGVLPPPPAGTTLTGGSSSSSTLGAASYTGISSLTSTLTLPS